MSGKYPGWRLLVAVLLLLRSIPASAAVYDTKSQCGGALKGWFQPKDYIPHLGSIFTVVQDKTGSIFWNDRKITQAQLADFLKRIPEGNPRPYAVLTPKEGTDCRSVAAMRNQLEKVLRCSDGWCGEGSGFTRYPGERLEVPRVP